MEATHASTPTDLAIGSRPKQATGRTAASMARDARGVAAAVPPALRRQRRRCCETHIRR